MGTTLQFIKRTYDLHRDRPRVLRMLLVCALTDKEPLAIVATDERTGVVAQRVGLPTDVDPKRELASFRLADGGLFVCRFWEVDHCAVYAESEAA